MGMIVQHNMNALNAYNKLNANVAGLKKASEKLSSGYRINRAGDDAAGLAISEKMRSQIRGLNQAVRNSQDGINMIQTFEGAAQETHSILQRMKELATESANGTYDNATDRAAIQLEFDQLNDELNQIADTDFNGTIVLNGGVMSDGLEAVNNEFDYGARAEQEAAKKAAEQALFDSAQNVVGGARFNNQSGTGAAEAAKTTIVDNSNYSKTDADSIWEKLGLDANEVGSIDVTFTFDGDKWVATAVTNAKDKAASAAAGGDPAKEIKVEVSAEDLAKLTTTNNKSVNDNGSGGFTVDGTTVNAVFNDSNVQKYDQLTITFENVGGDYAAPENVGVKEDSFKVTKDDDHGFKDGPKVTMGDDLTLENLKGEHGAAIAAALKKISETDTLITVSADGSMELDTTAGKADWAAEGYTLSLEDDGTLKLADDDGNEFVLATITAPTAEDPDGKAKATFTLDFANYNVPTEADIKANSTATTGSALATLGMFDEAAASGGVSNSDAFKHSTAILTYAENITLQTGARSKDAVNFTFLYNKADMGDLDANLNISARKEGLNTENLKLSNQSDANDAIDQIDKAINKVSMVRASFGAIQNRLEHKITNLTTTSENLTEAESSIRDTDMASEMMNYTKYNILQQAAQSMLAQANQQPQSILQLLG